MITVHNRLQQPLTIGEDTIKAGGSKEYEQATAELKKFAARGHITIVRHKDDGTDKVVKVDTPIATNEAVADGGADGVNTPEQEMTKSMFTGTKTTKGGTR